MEFRGPGGTKRRRERASVPGGDERGQCPQRGRGGGGGGATLAELRGICASDKLL